MRCRTLRATVGVLVWVLSALAGQEKKPLTQPAETPAKDTRLDDAELNKTTGAPVDLKTYEIGPEDILMVRVWREQDLSGAIVVRPDGNVTLPLVGEIKAAGLTPSQLQASLVAAFTKFINKPDVLVSVASVRSKKYLISGEVNRPGVYPLVLPTRVLEAIVAAGGLRDFANKKNIVIMRGDQRLKFNYKDVIKGKNTRQNILLENGDHVIVE